MGKSITYRFLARIVGVVILVLGIGCLNGGNFAKSFIADQLGQQEIDIPTNESLDGQVAGGLDPDVADSLRPWAGEIMSSGNQARPYAAYIGEHMQAAAERAGYPDAKF